MTIDQMWERLAQHQPYADQRGYGPEWARMCEEKTPEAATAAAEATAARAAEAAADAEAAEAETAVYWIKRSGGEK